MTFDGYKARTDVVAFTRATATTSHKSYSALVKGYNLGGMNATVLSITKKAMNRAANGLADLIISIKNKVPGK